MPVVSKKQAALFGAVAGGAKTKATGLSPAQAKEALTDVNVKKLPESVHEGRKHLAEKIHEKDKGKKHAEHNPY